MKKLGILVGALVFVSSVFAAEVVKEGEAEGYKDQITVKVTMDGDKITKIDVAHKDTPRIARPAVEQITKEIIEKQTTDVENVAGATYTSEGIKNAVKAALEK
jgi:uncharacterized protein with FMN-binding domain